MVEKGIRGEMCHAIHQHAKANNRYMKYYNKNKESLYFTYLDANNFYSWAMSQKLPVNNFECIENTSQFNEDFIKGYDEESDEGYFLKVDVQYPEKLHKLHNDLPFLPERTKTENFKKLFTNLHDKTECAIHIRNLKQALNHGLGFKKVHSVIKVNQKSWIKPYIDMNTKLRK